MGTEQAREHARVDVAARKDRHGRARGRQVLLPQQPRCHGHGTTRLGYQVRLHGDPPHPLPYLILSHSHNVVHVPEDVLERQRSHLLDPQRISDRPLGAGRRPGDPLAAPERIAGIRRQFRFHPDHLRPGTQATDGRRDPGDQPATADRDHHQVSLRTLGRDLQAYRALTSDHRTVIKRRDEGEPVTADEILRGCHPRCERGLHGHDPGTHPADGGNLHRWCVLRDHDHCRDAEERSRVRHSLGVVAAGVGHHPPLAHGGGQRADRRISPAQLE
jgi:hypothetical protein